MSNDNRTKSNSSSPKNTDTSIIFNKSTGIFNKHTDTFNQDGTIKKKPATKNDQLNAKYKSIITLSGFSNLFLGTTGGALLGSIGGPVGSVIGGVIGFIGGAFTGIAGSVTHMVIQERFVNSFGDIESRPGKFFATFFTHSGSFGGSAGTVIGGIFGFISGKSIDLIEVVFFKPNTGDSSSAEVNKDQNEDIESQTSSRNTATIEIDGGDDEKSESTINSNQNQKELINDESSNTTTTTITTTEAKQTNDTEYQALITRYIEKQVLAKYRFEYTDESTGKSYTIGEDTKSISYDKVIKRKQFTKENKEKIFLESADIQKALVPYIQKAVNEQNKKSEETINNLKITDSIDTVDEASSTNQLIEEQTTEEPTFYYDSIDESLIEQSAETSTNKTKIFVNESIVEEIKTNENAEKESEEILAQNTYNKYFDEYSNENTFEKYSLKPLERFCDIDFVDGETQMQAYLAAHKFTEEESKKIIEFTQITKSNSLSSKNEFKEDLFIYYNHLLKNSSDERANTIWAEELDTTFEPGKFTSNNRYDSMTTFFNEKVKERDFASILIKFGLTEVGKKGSKLKNHPYMYSFLSYGFLKGDIKTIDDLHYFYHQIASLIDENKMSTNNQFNYPEFIEAKQRWDNFIKSFNKNLILEVGSSISSSIFGYFK